MKKLQSAADDLHAWFIKSVTRNRPAEQSAQTALNKEAVQLIGWQHLIKAQISNYNDPFGDGWVSKTTLYNNILSPLGLIYTKRSNSYATEHWHIVAPNTVLLDEGIIFKDTNGGNAVPDLSRPINLTRFMLDLQALVDEKVKARMNALFDEYVSSHALRLFMDGFEIADRVNKKYEFLLDMSYTVYDPLYCYWIACVRTEIDLQLPVRDRLLLLGYDCTLPSNESTESEEPDV